MTTRTFLRTAPMPMRASLVVAAALLAWPSASLAQSAGSTAANKAAQAYAEQLEAARADALRFAQSMQLDTARLATESRALAAESLAAAFAQDPRPLVLGQRDYLVFADSAAYEAGISALDSERWQSAVDSFTRVIKAGKSRVDGAMYWKAYALNRLGQRSEAQAALQELFKAHPNSRYLDDARVLDIEIKQRSGQNVTPEDQANDELKGIAFNALMRNDPERAIPLAQQLLQGRGSPKLKQQILFSLAMSATPKAQEVVSAIARGGQGVNPDLQMKAIKYLGAYGRNNTSLLGDVYNGTKDPDVRRQIIRSLASSRDDKQLITIARNETTTDLRVEAIRQLGSLMGGGNWTVFADNMVFSGRVPAVTMVAPPVAARGSGGGTGSGSGRGAGSGTTVTPAPPVVAPNLAEVYAGRADAARRERAKVDTAAISEALVQIYRTDKDVTVKKAVIGALASGQAAKSLVDIARSESNPELKREIVSRLSSMKSKEATDYLMEILK